MERYSILDAIPYELVVVDAAPNERDYGASEKDAKEYEQTEWGEVAPRLFVFRGVT